MKPRSPCPTLNLLKIERQNILRSTCKNADEKKKKSLSDISEPCACACCQKNHCSESESTLSNESVAVACQGGEYVAFLATSNRYKTECQKNIENSDRFCQDFKQSRQNFFEEQKEDICFEFQGKNSGISEQDLVISSYVSKSDNEIVDCSETKTYASPKKYCENGDLKFSEQGKKVQLIDDKNELLDEASFNTSTNCKEQEVEIPSQSISKIGGTSSNISSKSFSTSSKKSETEIILQATEDIHNLPPYFKCSFENAPINCVFQQIICYPNSEPVIVNERPNANKKSDLGNDHIMDTEKSRSYSDSLNNDNGRNSAKSRCCSNNSIKESQFNKKCDNQADNIKTNQSSNLKKNRESITDSKNEENAASFSGSNKMDNNAENSKFLYIYNILNRMKASLDQKMYEMGRKFCRSITNCKSREGEQSYCKNVSGSDFLKITHVVPLGRRCLLVHWKVLSNETQLSYEVTVDGCIVSRLTSSLSCVSEIICGVDINTKHTICVTPISGNYYNTKGNFCKNSKFPLCYNNLRGMGSSYKYEPT